MNADTLPIERACKKCGETKLLGDFVKTKACKYGYSYECKDCGNTRVGAWKRSHPERVAASNKRYRTPEVLQAEKGRIKAEEARRRGSTVKELVHPLVVLEMHDGVCGFCGEDVDPFEFQIDHIIPCSAAGEHSYANMQPVHFRCNLEKRKFDRRLADAKAA
jgi:5-methylcytosine-specific restriction endonuclease McrA